MIKKLLIANRGEIACRIMATCQRLGIRTVAVYSDADANALHVRTADEAVHIGPAEAANSYLKPEAIIAACKATGADAVHPGYGFLSERVVLVQMCEQNGITWVGPNANAIERMGSKIESKRIAEAAKVEGVPGYHGDAQDDAALTAAAKKIGYPVLIKASAGGGGRGMRRVESEKDLLPAIQLARKEAQAGFGDPKLLIEKLIQRPRHLEVQLAGDKHGGLIHLYERECSVQRNYQKVVEEAPAPRLTDKTRKALHDAAIKLGKNIGYDSLGTVEFILEEGEEQPYFLEMNTRLQVEHPVTELVTGLDLVELQIRVAAGEKLPIAQDQVKVVGSAIEVRLNAEDPANGYRPNVGTVVALHLPKGEGVRIDTGIAAGSTITPHYDSMLAKVIAYGPSRPVAAQRLSAALGDYAIFGVGTNHGFLRDIIARPKFLAGELTTRFIEEEFPGGWKAAEQNKALPISAAAVWAAELEQRKASAALGPFVSLGGFRILGRAGRPGKVTVAVEHGGAKHTILLSGGAGNYDAVVDGTTHKVDVTLREGPVQDVVAHVAVDGVSRRFGVALDSGTVGLAAEGISTTFRVAAAIENVGGGAGENAGGGSRVMATMPGLINAVDVKVGQEVELGQSVVVLEAMKLMIQLVAPVSGKVKEVFCTPGQTVPVGTVLVEIEPAAA